MPPNKKCPACAELVLDWHFEWYTVEDQKKIRAGIAAMECPFCMAGVAYDGLSVRIAEPGTEKAKRDILKAARWASDQAANKNLRGYLNLEEPGQPYLDHWTDTEVQEADRKVAAESE